MSNQNIKVEFNQAFNDYAMAQAFGLGEEKFIEIAEATPGLVIDSERLESVEQMMSDRILQAGIDGHFFLVSDENTTAVVSLNPVPLQTEGQNRHFFMYNPLFVKHMEPEYIQAMITYAIELYKLRLNGDLVCKNRRTGEFIYKGEEVTFSLADNIDTPVEQCAPWRQDLLAVQCRELDIAVTNDMVKLTGLEADKVHAIYSVCKANHNASLAFRKAAVAEGEKSNA